MGGSRGTLCGDTRCGAALDPSSLGFSLRHLPTLLRSSPIVCQQKWSAHTPYQHNTLSHFPALPQGAVCSLVVLPNGRLASGSADKTINIWRLSTGKLERSLKGHTHTVRPEGKDIPYERRDGNRER